MLEISNLILIFMLHFQKHGIDTFKVIFGVATYFASKAKKW